MKKTYISIFALAMTVLTINQTFAQNIGINGTGATPNTSSMLDISASDKGLLIPRVSLTATNAATPITTPATSLLVYNTSTAGAGATAVTPGYYYWDGAKWVRFQTGTSNHNTLNQAYNEGGAGLGRVITANSGAVTINGTTTVSGGQALSVTQSSTNAFGIGVTHSGTGPGIGIVSSGTSNSFAAIQAETNSSTANNAAVFGQSKGASYGIKGEVLSTATGASALYGKNFRTTGGYGVLGEGFNGVVGIAASGDGYGVYGVNTLLTGLGIGTYGYGYHGVYGQTTNVTTGFAGYFTADIGADGGIYTMGPGTFNISDGRLKSDVVKIENALDKIMLIEPKYYTIKTKTKPDLESGIIVEKTRQEYGVIAQELELIFPSMISEKAVFNNAGDDTEYKAVNYVQLIPVLIQAMKEQQVMIEKQNQKIELLNQKITELTK